MIEFKNVTMVYEIGTKALQDVSLKINDGEFVFLVGPSGSGKSTIVKLLTAELHPTKGSVHVNGFDLERIKKKQIPYMRRTVGVIFQDFRLVRQKTVYENVAFAMRVIGASEREIRSRVPYVLQLVGLEEKGKHLPDELSGGEQQRVAIARALVNNPSMIIADEPTGNLDPVKSLEIMLLLEQINALGTTVMIVTHEAEMVNRFHRSTISMKKNKSIGYLLREGIRSIFRHGFMSFAAICVTVACLIIMGSFSLILYNLNMMVRELEQENEILVYVDENLTEAEAKSVGSKINLIDNVNKSEFVSREQALENFIENQDDDSVFAGIDSTTLRHRFVVTLVDNAQMETTVEAIRPIEGVADISAPYELEEGFRSLEHVLQIVTIAIIAILLVVSLFIISNTIKLAMLDRRDEIAIMKIVGATDSFIRLPFVVEGFVIGIVSAAIAFGLQWGLYDLLVRNVQAADSLKMIHFVPFRDALWVMIPAFAIAGLFVGVFGSLMSIRKFLDV